LFLFQRGLATSDIGEYQIKAAFLYNFARFVDWPPPNAGPVVIAVFGRDPFGDALERTVHGKAIDGRPFVVRRTSRLEEVKQCQILFISSVEKKRTASILSAVRGEAILTVGEYREFLEEGGGVSFSTENDRVRFDVNLRATRDAGLHLSARLLNLARLVKD
jgi:hypothetical protein